MHRESSFEPKIVKKRHKRLTGVDEVVISLAAKGLTAGEVQAHLAEVYGADVSRQTMKIRDGAVANRSIYVALAVARRAQRRSGVPTGQTASYGVLPISALKTTGSLPKPRIILWKFHAAVASRVNSATVAAVDAETWVKSSLRSSS